MSRAGAVRSDAMRPAEGPLRERTWSRPVVLLWLDVGTLEVVSLGKRIRDPAFVPEPAPVPFVTTPVLALPAEMPPGTALRPEVVMVRSPPVEAPLGA